MILKKNSFLKIYFLPHLLKLLNHYRDKRLEFLCLLFFIIIINVNFIFYIQHLKEKSFMQLIFSMYI